MEVQGKKLQMPTGTWAVSNEGRYKEDINQSFIGEKRNGGDLTLFVSRLFN